MFVFLIQITHEILNNNYRFCDVLRYIMKFNCPAKDDIIVLIYI